MRRSRASSESFTPWCPLSSIIISSVVSACHSIGSKRWMSLSMPGWRTKRTRLKYGMENLPPNFSHTRPCARECQLVTMLVPRRSGFHLKLPNSFSCGGSGSLWHRTQKASRTGCTSRANSKLRSGPRHGRISSSGRLAATRGARATKLCFSWHPAQERYSPLRAVNQLRITCRDCPSASSGWTAIGVLAGTLK